VACHAAIFQIEKEEMDDNAVDFQLVSQCKASIRRLCSNDASKTLECLKVFKIIMIGFSFILVIMDFIDFVYLKVHLDDNSLEGDCKEIILARIAEQKIWTSDSILFRPKNVHLTYQNFVERLLLFIFCFKMILQCTVNCMKLIRFGINALMIAS